MTGAARRWLVRLGGFGAVGTLSFLVLAQAVALAGIIPVAAMVHGVEGAAAAAVASGACLAGGGAGLALGGASCGAQQAAYRLLISAALRMSVPLAIAAIMLYRDAALIQAGFGYYLVLFYLVMLAAETVLAVGRSARHSLGNKPGRWSDSKNLT